MASHIYQCLQLVCWDLKLSSIMFWILIALVVANFFYTAIYVLKKNREFINKK